MQSFDDARSGLLRCSRALLCRRIGVLCIRVADAKLWAEGSQMSSFSRIPRTPGKIGSSEAARPASLAHNRTLEPARRAISGNANGRTTPLDSGPGIAWNLGATSIFPTDGAARPALPVLPSVAEPKLLIEETDGPLERDADRTADAVMAAPDGSGARPALRAPLSPRIVAAPRAVTRALRDPGRPLDAATRDFMESRFQLDFSRVRIHVDESAATATAALNARAFAAGSHVVIDPAEYGGDRGKRLIAHELSHAVQQAGFPSAAAVIQCQGRSGPGLILPRAAIKAIGNADVNQVIDAFPADLTNGQAFTITITTADGTKRTFGIEITITPGPPPVTATHAAETKKKIAPPGSTAPPTFVMQIYQALPDATRTLFHELLHLRLAIDRELPDDQRSQTFGRYSQQFQMATDEALLRATGAFNLKKDVLDRISDVRHWFETFVKGFKTPEAFSAAHDEDFLQHFIEEKVVNQEAGAASISPGGKKPGVTRPLTTGTIAMRYAGTVAETFKQVASAQNLDGAVAAAEQRAKESTSLPSLDDLKQRLAAAMQKWYDAIDAQLAQIAAFRQQAGQAPSPTPPPRQLTPREQTDEMLQTEPPLRLPP